MSHQLKDKKLDYPSLDVMDIEGQDDNNNPKIKYNLKKIIIISIVVIIFLTICIIIVVSNLSSKSELFFRNENQKIYQNSNFKLNMSFALNVDEKGNISEHIYKAFDHVDKRQTEMNKNNTIIKCFDSKAQVEVSKKTILTDEINETLIKNKENDKKKYVLISYLVQKLEVSIKDKKELKIKESFQNSLKKIENSNSTDKKQEFKNLINQIGFYVPNEVILGGRIDITFVLKEGDNITDLISNQNTIFDYNSNNSHSILKSLEKYDNYSCNVIGGRMRTFCRDKNLTKWYQDLDDGDLAIILYNNLQNIGNFLENDLQRTFRKYYYTKVRNYTDGIYRGDIKNNKRDGYGEFEYFNGYLYLGEWKEDKRDGEHGILYNNKIMIYNGQWKDDMKNGNGILYKEGKEKYNGEWKNDKYHGKGILYFKENDWLEAKFKNGKCKSVIKSSSFLNKLWCWWPLH